MPSNTDIVKRSQREAIFKVSTTDRSAHLFILSVVEETWVSKIEDADTYFRSVLAEALLSHLIDNCDSLDNTNAIDIRLAMPSLWGEYLGVPEFILWIEKGQKKAAHTNLPIESIPT